MAHSQEEKQLTKTNIEEAQTLDLLDKDLNLTLILIHMLKKLWET